MATVYGAYNPTGWKPSGSSYYKYYQAWVEYWISAETDTTISFSAYMGVHISSSVNASFNARLDFSDYGAVATATGSTVFGQSNTVTLIGTHTYTYQKGETARTIATTGYVWSSQGKWTGEWVSATGYVTVPALASYAITYDANGGQDAPGNQVKYLNKSITLSSRQPTRIGYTFSKWNTAADGSGTDYNPGGTYTENAAATLYAQWTKNTYTVTYNANGGSGSMSASTFTYDVEATLKTNSFTRADYLFLGWSTTNNGAVVYTNGQKVKNLATSGTVPLYAVWKKQFTPPDLQTPNARRATNGIYDDDGTGAIFSVYCTPARKETSLGNFSYIPTTITVKYKLSTAADSTYQTLSNPQTISSPQNVPANQSTWTLADSSILTDEQYTVLFLAEGKDNNVVKESSTLTTIIPFAKFTVDFNPENNSIGIFTVASSDDDSVTIAGDVFLILNDNDSGGTDDRLLTAFRKRGWTIYND
jgi:uncharacterized repeat protein (TIGR02543 family)